MRLSLSALLLLCLAASAEEQRPLRFSVTESWAMPMIKIVDGQATGGILYVLQEFEVWLYGFPDDTKDICELRRNEIATLYDETTKQEKRSEYESFLYEEYLWYVARMT